MAIITNTVCDLATPQTLSNKTLDASCVIQSFLASSTLAALPAAGSAGRLAWLSDDIRGLLVDTGSQWIPVGGKYANVLVFGADPTGATSSRAAFQLAADSGYPVYIPTGTYLFDNTIDVTTPDQVWFGDGWGSVLRCAAATFNLFTLNTAPRVQFRNLRMEGAATDTTTLHYAIMTTGGGFASPDVQVVNCHFTGPDSTKGFNNLLLTSQGCNRWFLFGNLVEQLVGTTANYGYGFQTERCTHHRIIANHYIGTPGRGRHAVYLATGTSYSLVALNLVENFNHSHLTTNSFSSQPTCEQNVFVMNICRGGGSFGVNEGAIGLYGNTQNTLVFNNQVYDYSGHGVVLDFDSEGDLLKYNTIKGNQIRNNGWSGVEVIGAKYTTVEGNTIIDNNQDTVDTYPGISVRSQGAATTEQSIGTAILGNRIQGTSHRVAIRIDPTIPLPTETVIKGNAVSPGSLGTYELHDADGVEYELDGVSYPKLTYSASIQLKATADIDNFNEVKPTDGNPFTVSNPPSGSERRGKKITLRIVNQTGGALGALSFSGLKTGAAWTQPGNGTLRSITFQSDGTSWHEIHRTTSDIPIS